MKSKPLLIAIVVATTTMPALSITKWPSDMKRTYVENCTQGIVAQGMMEFWSRKYCSCLADGMENEFGVEEYDLMRQGRPNASGSPVDGRLNNVFDACKEYFPKRKHRPGSPFQ